MRFGDIFEDDHLFPINSAHVSCTSVWIKGAFVSWLQQLLNIDENDVPTVSIVAGCDLRAYNEVGQLNLSELLPGQNKLLPRLYRMGIAPTHTCAW